MPHPTLHFAFDPEFDANLAWLFYSDPEYGGTNFWNKGAISYHEKLKNIEDEKNKKSFFVFLSQNDKDALFTIFHELLHFYFYHYCLSAYPKFFKNLDTETGAFWEIAELFNGVVMQTPAFTKLYGIKPSLDYPKLRASFKQAKRKWNGDVDQWVKEFALPYVREQNEKNDHKTRSSIPERSKRINMQTLMNSL